MFTSPAVDPLPKDCHRLLASPISESQSESGISQHVESNTGVESFLPADGTVSAAPATSTVMPTASAKRAMAAGNANINSNNNNRNEGSANTAAIAATAAVLATPPHKRHSSPSATTAASTAVQTESTKAKNQNVRRNVYISGIPPFFRSEEFRQLCMQFGRIEAAKLCVDNRNAPTKAYGFALYYSEESAAACIRGLNGSFLQGRCVQARLADSHATPQPLGDDGAAANTTIPPPPRAHNDRRSNGINSRANNNNNNGINAAAVANSRRSNGNGSNPLTSQTSLHGLMASNSHSNTNSAQITPPNVMMIPPGAATNFTSAGLPMPLCAMMPAGAVPASTAESPGTAIPLDVASYYNFMAMQAASAAAAQAPLPPPHQQLQQQQQTTAVGAMQHPSSTSVASNTRTVSPAIQSNGAEVPPHLSPQNTNSGAFGAVGTPVSGSLMTSGPGTVLTNASALSPASLALSPPLLSSHSTDSGRSVSPDESRNAAPTSNLSYTTSAMPGVTSSPFMFLCASTAASNPSSLPSQAQQQLQMMTPQFPQPMQQLPQHLQPQMAMMGAAGPDGSPTLMYFPLPNGGYGAFATAAMPSMMAAPPNVTAANPHGAPMAATGANAGAAPLMFFTVPPPGVVAGAPAGTAAPPLSMMPQPPTFMQLTPPPASMSSAAQTATPSNYMMLDANGHLMPVQMMRQ